MRSGPPRNHWAWSSITCADSLESNKAIDNDLKLYKVQIPHQKTNSPLPEKKRGAGGESDGIQERPQLVQCGHHSGPGSSGLEPTAFI